MLFAGMAQTVLVMVLWLAELLQRQAGTTLPLTIPAIWAHAVLMLYGIFIFFIFGFLMTVYPRWMATPLVQRSCYVPTFLLLATGTLLFYLGLFVSARLVLAALFLYLLGWAWGYRGLLHVYRVSQRRNDREHEMLLNVFLVTGWTGLAGFAVALAFDIPGLFAFTRTAGVWLFLVPVLFTVGHRMIPFFTSSALNPIAPYRMVRTQWALPVMAACVVGHAALELAGLARLTFITDTPLLALTLYHTFVWNLVRALPVRMLAMLHIAFLWLSVAVALFLVQSLVLFLTGNLILPRAPLHALGIGFFTALSVGMVTRVTLGHSGNPLIASNITWFSFIGINVVAIIRIASELPLPPTVNAMFNVAAAGGWLAVMLPWVAQYLPLFLRPRSDGQPG